MKHLIVLFSLLPFAAAAAPKAELWDLWVPANEASRTRVDHSPWDRFLERYLVTGDPSGVYLFSYSRVSGENRALLEQYLEGLQAVRVEELNRSEQMAFWLNLYNALTVKVVLDHWPVASIRDIRLGGGAPFSRGPWDAPLAEIQGRPVTLNDIEHRILRPIWKDPRIHYAVNCASIGCPNLQPVAFTAENLPVLLERAAVMYVNDPRGASVEDGTLWLSSIYDWFAGDFGDSTEALLRHVHRYADAPLRRSLEPFLDGRGRVRHRYDWSINAAD